MLRLWSAFEIRESSRSVSYARTGSSRPQLSTPIRSLMHAVTDKVHVTPVQHIIVLSCTNRKRKDAYPHNQRLRDIPPAPPRARAAAWIETVAGVPAWGPARDLYLGEYWQAGLDLARAAAHRSRTEVYVLSAGLGLVRSDAAVPGYAATFTRGHPDSVLGQSESPDAVRREWWDALAHWTGPGDRGSPRKLSEVAGTPGAHLLVCAGRDYVGAAADDLRAAQDVLGNDRLVIIGSGDSPEGLADVWVQCPGQLRMRFGGSMSSTGVRVARAALEGLRPREFLGAHRAREFIAASLRCTEPLPRFDRTRLSDSDVLAWIHSDAKAHPGASNKTAALRRLRDGGRACEQSRFGRLYDAARGEQR